MYSSDLNQQVDTYFKNNVDDDECNTLVDVSFADDEISDDEDDFCTFQPKHVGNE